MFEPVANPRELLGTILSDVSRSFYQTLRILPGAVRPQIGLAYLLARATDTIADTEIVPVSGRLEALEKLRSRILGQSQTPLDFTQFIRPEASSAPTAYTVGERVLLERIEQALTVLVSFRDTDQQLIRDVLFTITSGQELDLQRFGRAELEAGQRPAPSIVALRSDAELDDYTYRVAGSVGEFWTRICRAHIFPRARLDDQTLLANGVRFGQGLQLVNILRDVPADLRKGRCYLPGESLLAIELAPGDLLDPRNETKLRPLYNRLLDRAQDCLKTGWTYTNMLPWRCVRVRLACAWPVLIGVQTLKRLRENKILGSRITD